MPKQVTFIHAADLHLGAPFRGLRALSPTWASRLLSAIPESYDRVIDSALKNEADFVVIAGDIFDSARASYADHLHFFEGLKRLAAAGIPVYLCTGNHDPFTSWQHDFFTLPENTTMLPADRPGFVVFKKDGKPHTLIAGRGYYNHSWSPDEDIAEGITRAAAQEATGADAPFAVAVLHTGLNLDPQKAPTDPAALMRAGMDYWALGHIHLRCTYPEKNPRIAFSGCIQGRDIKETGERGVYKVTLTEGRPNQVEFIPTASVVWERLKVDVSECKSLSEMHEKIIRELFRANSTVYCEEMCVRISLVGTTELHQTLEMPGVLRDMRKGINDAFSVFYCDALLNKTVQPFDKKALLKESLFPSVFLQVSTALKDDADESLAYLQNELLKKNLQLPHACEKEIPTLLEEAENLVLSLLGGDTR